MDSIPSPQSFIFSDDYICQWDSCLKNFDDAELLYEHVRHDHVGRKASHNLCLTCRWDKCSVPTFAKRDHITSHLRVHIASKPYHCEICRKGFKRPQDLKKHEKTHQDGTAPTTSTTTSTTTTTNNNIASAPTAAHLQPTYEQPYQPLTPPSYQDRSPSIAASTVSSIQSPYSMPLSPASMVDPTDSWSNPGLASPSYSTNSDLYSSPRTATQDVDLLHHPALGRPNIDVSGTYYGAFPTAPMGYEDMISPTSAKRSRDGFDEILSDTLGSFAMEAKKKRLDPSYNEDMMGRLNALSAILEVNPLTPDRLLTSLPDVSDWNQFNQLNQFCSTLFEDVSGEVFEPQSFDTLFPDYEQKQNPLALDAGYGIDSLSNFNAGGVNPGLNNNASNGLYGSTTSSQSESIYSAVLPDDPFVPSTSAASMSYGSSSMAWDMNSMASGMVPKPGVVSANPAANRVQQQVVNPFASRYLTPVQNRPSHRPSIKTEPKEEVFEPTVVVKVERTYADMSTQTRAKQEKLAAEGGMMMMQRPASKDKKKTSAYEGMDAATLMLNAPDVPDTPLPEEEVEEISADDLDYLDDEDETTTTASEGEREQGESDSIQQTPSSRYEELIQKARAKQAAAAAAAAATSEPIDPLEAMTRQLEQTHLDSASGKALRKPPTTRPVTEGDMERQIRAAKARALCSQDPVRKQHAEVVLNLLKSIDMLMADHQQKLAQWKASQQQAGAAGASIPRGPVTRTASPAISGYPRPGVSVQNQGPIRTVSSYLTRRTPHQPSPLHQDHTADEAANPGYGQLMANMAEDSDPSRYVSVEVAPPAVATESAAVYPGSHLDASEEVFELSEEERRFIEEDNAQIAAAQAAAAAASYAQV
ncbi:hypothetical protein EC968_003402 [Mortierella alpina]|nr:hypothetical protein EC968_003402 [Mortierella alpina]